MTFTFPEWEDDGECPVSGDRTAFPDESEECEEPSYSCISAVFQEFCPYSTYARARLFFSFLIAVSISSGVGGPVSMVALGTALAASVCRRISGVGGGGVLLNCSTKCSFHLCSCSLGSLSWSPSLLTTGGS